MHHYIAMQAEGEPGRAQAHPNNGYALFMELQKIDIDTSFLYIVHAM